MFNSPELKLAFRHGDGEDEHLSLLAYIPLFIQRLQLSFVSRPMEFMCQSALAESNIKKKTKKTKRSKKSTIRAEEAMVDAMDCNMVLRFPDFTLEKISSFELDTNDYPV